MLTFYELLHFVLVFIISHPSPRCLRNSVSFASPSKRCALKIYENRNLPYYHSRQWPVAQKLLLIQFKMLSLLKLT